MIEPIVIVALPVKVDAAPLAYVYVALPCRTTPPPTLALSDAVNVPVSAVPDFESEPDTFTDTDEVSCMVFAVAVTDQFVEFV